MYIHVTCKDENIDTEEVLVNELSSLRKEYMDKLSILRQEYGYKIIRVLGALDECNRSNK